MNVVDEAAAEKAVMNGEQTDMENTAVVYRRNLNLETLTSIELNNLVFKKTIVLVVSCLHDPIFFKAI